MQSGDWAQARALAAADPDPVAAELVEYLRILNAVDGAERPSAAEVARFIDKHPSWPAQALLGRRLADAIADAADLRDVLALCASHPQSAPAALARCAEAEGWAGQGGKSSGSASAAWTGGLVQGEEDFLARWGPVLTQGDQWMRFERLVGNDDAASRQVARLDPLHRVAAQARLAFRHDDPGALTALAFVAPALRSDPALLLDESRSLRRTQAWAAALALWQGAGFAAEARSPPAARLAFWAERDILARKELAQGDAAGAFALADDQSLDAEQAVESRFLAGWILLRRLHDPERAAARFAALAASSHSAITQARAHYWLARAAEAAQAAATLAAAEYAKAAAWPTTFYGQQAEAVLGQDETAHIDALKDPAIDQQREHTLAGKELGRAAATLVGWGDASRARSFVLRLAQDAQTPEDVTACAELALHLGLPETAVAIARLAGHDGVVLPQRGWPMPFEPPASAAGQDLALGVMRQESSFDPQVVSPAGAIGLMQMMPRTALQISRQDGAGLPDLRDPQTNMRLGTRTLDALLHQFGGVVPYALAAYDAGGRRVRDWIAGNGDITRANQEAVIDWIELIPFNETRNYVQRVMENAAIYHAKQTALR